MTRKKGKEMLIFPCETWVQGRVCRLNYESLTWQIPVSLKWALVCMSTALTEVHILKTASAHSCEKEAERGIYPYLQYCLKNKTESDFNNIFHNSAKPKCSGYSGYGTLFWKTAGFIIFNTKNRYWSKNNLKCYTSSVIRQQLQVMS